MSKPFGTLKTDASHRKSLKILSLVEYLRIGELYYCLTSLVVVLGVLAGRDCIKPRPSPESDSPNLIGLFTRWDGRWYERIALQGYSYDPDGLSSVAFFPVFPLLGWLAVSLIDLTADVALLMVAHLCLVSSFVLMAAYASQRYPNAPSERIHYVLLVLGLAPFTFYFRMAYSESPFLFFAILALYGMERKWSLLIIALIIGLATATRPVGVGLLAPLILHIWHRSSTTMSFISNYLCIVPIACWGIAGYMSYQYGQFSDPLAFAKSHGLWRARPPAPLLDELIALPTLEPIWSVFDSSSPCFWKRREPSYSFLFNPAIFNCGFFLLAVILTVVGKYKRWLSSYEVTLVVSLLFIPYVGRGYDMCMASMARFTSVAFPIYLVFGNLLWRLPAPLAAGLLALSSVLLAVYAALFAASYPFF